MHLPAAAARIAPAAVGAIPALASCAAAPPWRYSIAASAVASSLAAAKLAITIPTIAGIAPLHPFPTPFRTAVTAHLSPC